uniref:Candidate secreted effector n=2 Tax=Meloidogyne incognita TaxID=6306 RepID=A0A914LNJ0_MELIC
MSIKLFIFFVFIIKIVNSGNFCGKLQVDEDDNNNNDSDERFVGNEGGLHEGDVIDFEEGFGPEQINGNVGGDNNEEYSTLSDFTENENTNTDYSSDYCSD